jgi:Rieske 2Fe-2S family protein
MTSDGNLDPSGTIEGYTGLTQPEKTLPAHWYYDADHYAAEVKQIWARNWIYMCRSNDLLAEMSFRTLRVGDQSVVVLRDTDGEIRAFHNVCRHRGSVLCEASAGQLASRLLVCPYHQWSYAPNDGRLVRTSSNVEPDAFVKRDYSLFPVAVARWRGCIFVNFDANAVFDGDSEFQRPSDNLVNFPLEAMVTGHTWRSEIACNWKVFWENFNECLHCPNIHPELVDLVPLYQRRIVDPHDVPDWQEHVGKTAPMFKGGMREGAQTWSMNASAQDRVIATLDDADLARGHTYATIWPSIFVAGYPDHVRIVRLLPLGPEKMELQSEWLFPQDTLNDPNYAVSNVVDFAVLVMQQDAHACELNQQGLRSPAYQHGVLMPEEYLLKRFQDWVRNALV